jgi:pimeloyl-ACP methyl ester carboxylesterase
MVCTEAAGSRHRWSRYGRPVLLLHGLLFDRTMWWSVGVELAGVCTVVASDLPGHADSMARAAGIPPPNQSAAGRRAPRVDIAHSQRNPDSAPEPGPTPTVSQKA